MTLDEAQACLADWKAHELKPTHATISAEMASFDGLEFWIQVWEVNEPAAYWLSAYWNSRSEYDAEKRRYLKEAS